MTIKTVCMFHRVLRPLLIIIASAASKVQGFELNFCSASFRRVKLASAFNDYCSPRENPPHSRAAGRGGKADTTQRFAPFKFISIKFPLQATLSLLRAIAS
jgi:hypothetical protein